MLKKFNIHVANFIFLKKNSLNFVSYTGADANAADNDQRTSLYVAARNGYQAVVALLLTQEGIQVGVGIGSQLLFSGHYLTIFLFK